MESPAILKKPSRLVITLVITLLIPYSTQQTLSPEEEDSVNATLLIEYSNQDYSTTTQTSSPSSETVLETITRATTSKLTSTDAVTTAELDEIKGLQDEVIVDGDTVAHNRSDQRNLRNARLYDKTSVNVTNIYKFLLKKKPYSKYWTVEQKWDDIFKRFMAIQGTVKNMMMKNFLRDIEYYADVSISHKCSEDLKFIQEYTKKSKNIRWLMHMFDSTGKSEAGMLTGNLANLGHVVQCIRARAPLIPSNDTFEERFFEKQTEMLGERFRGKFCLASVRPVLPEKPRLVSRFSEILDVSLLSNISYMGEPVEFLKQRAMETTVQESVHKLIDRNHYRLDQIPFESELFQYLIMQRNFMYTLPRFMGVCYPSSCTKDDIRYSIQKSMDDQHQVVDIEFDCEEEEHDAWDWFITSRLIIYVFFIMFVSITFAASVARFILVDKLRVKHRMNNQSGLARVVAILDILSMDKCAGVLFIKTKIASPIVDQSKVENNRSTAIDALKGLLILMLIYSELVYLGCLPIPFMWSKWSDAMFPFYRSLLTQPFLNSTIWTEAFYIISAYLISTKILENHRPNIVGNKPSKQALNFASYSIERYVRLVLPMMAFIMLNYIWPRLSNGFVMQDQAKKLMAPCDSFGWTNMLMFHNHYSMNETCLWPSHVSASFFQLHLISYPILLLLLHSLSSNTNGLAHLGSHGLKQKISSYSGLSLVAFLATFGLVYPALIASQQKLIVPFLIDYIDYDNYRRVIEWMVMPTINHLFSHMAGIWLAYLVVRRRVLLETSKAASLSDWREAFIQREGSFESVMSSATQDFRSSQRNLGSPSDHQKADSQLPSNYLYQSREVGKQQTTQNGCLGGFLGSAVISCLMFISLTSSWFWNGLGQPMTGMQTFWYIIATKLTFTLTFAYLFHKHFATRRNSSNPWMLTRLLVPIGRMSLMAFYVSWVVIWFDLLASLYQWHPSHYFVIEKFSEIVFITLILSMFSYGTFEGTVKIIEYRRRADRLKQLPVSATSDLNEQQGFDWLFKPDYKDSNNPDSSGDKSTAGALQNHSQIGEQNASSRVFNTSKVMNKRLADCQVTTIDFDASKDASCTTLNSQDVKPTNSGARHLSIADQYKLNAELRANYSFASIGLYESAYATDDLPLSGDPQMSPRPKGR